MLHVFLLLSVFWSDLIKKESVLPSINLALGACDTLGSKHKMQYQNICAPKMTIPRDQCDIALPDLTTVEETPEGVNRLNCVCESEVAAHPAPNQDGR